MNCVASELENCIPVLKVESLTKNYRGKNALEDITFTIPAASLIAILGPAGAGKTTTLRLIAGLENPDSGTITLSGKDAVSLQPKDRDIAMIFDNIALYPNKTGYENIASPLAIRKETQEEIEKKVSEIASTLKISPILKRLPKTMSGGERQRIALGRALIRSPKLFLLDEPLSSLDAKLRIELRAELRRLQQELGYTFLLATPDFQEAMAIADTVIMLREGHIVQVAPPQQLYNEPVDREVARFIGAPQINILKAKWVADEIYNQMEFADALHQIPSHLKHLATSDQGQFEIGIRPENLKLSDSDSADINGKVSDIEPLGLKAVLTVLNDQTELRLIIESSEAVNIKIGSEVGVNILEPNSLLAFDSKSGLRL